MESSIEHYLMDMTDQLAFLNIEGEALKGFDDPPDDLVIPIFVEDIKKMAQQASGFSTSQIASAILFLLGVDGDFRFKKEYMGFLKNAIDRPEAYAAELAMKKYDNRSYKEALVYMRSAMEVAASLGVTPTVLVLTVFGETLGAWSITTDFVVNMPVFRRTDLHPDVPRLIGDFTGSLLVNLSTGGFVGLADKVRDNSERVAEALAHSRYSGFDVGGL